MKAQLSNRGFYNRMGLYFSKGFWPVILLSIGLMGAAILMKVVLF